MSQNIPENSSIEFGIDRCFSSNNTGGSRCWNKLQVVKQIWLSENLVMFPQGFHLHYKVSIEWPPSSIYTKTTFFSSSDMPIMSYHFHLTPACYTKTALNKNARKHSLSSLLYGQRASLMIADFIFTKLKEQLDTVGEKVKRLLTESEMRKYLFQYGPCHLTLSTRASKRISQNVWALL